MEIFFHLLTRTLVPIRDVVESNLENHGGSGGIVVAQSDRILIIGAGIGGLTAALALQQRGFKPMVYERSSMAREVGAGVILWQNAR